MPDTKAKTAGIGAPRIARALIWSASAHLLAFSSLLLLGAGSAPGRRQVVVDVFLVGSPGRTRAEVNRPVLPSPAGDPHRAAVSLREKDPPSVAPSPFPREPETVEEEVLRPGKQDAAVGALVPGTLTDSGHALEIPDPGEKATGAVQAFHAPSPDAPDPVRAGGDSRAGAGTALLRERIQSRIVYPEEAVRRGEQGEVLLRIRIGMGGIPREIRIARSSGAPRLDEAASRGVARAAPLPSDPGWVEVPVRFRLR